MDDRPRTNNNQPSLPTAIGTTAGQRKMQTLAVCINKTIRRMKKQMIFLLTGTFVFAAAFSQDIEAVKKQMYYERWNGAEQVLNQMIRADSSNLDNYYWLTEVLIEDK